MSLSESSKNEVSSSSLSAEHLAQQLLDEPDRLFVDAMRAVGLMSELTPKVLLRIASELEGSDAERRRVELMELYYDGGEDGEASARRRMSDWFFVQKLGELATAASLVARLATLAPELGAVALERIGGGDDGPLVVRSGEHVAAVLDDYDEETESDEYDLAEAERRGRVPMVTVRGLVRALNVLLDRNGVRERMVALRGDEEREVYVALGVAEAIQLARDGFLEDEDAEGVMELGAW